MFKRLLCVLVLAFSYPAIATAGDLVLKSSVKYDALCLAGMLTGDPFYTQFYEAEYKRFSALMTAEDKAAFGDLKRLIKDERGGLVGPQLALILSVIDEETIAGLIAALKEPTALKAALATRGLIEGQGLSADWTKEDWDGFEVVRPRLIAALGFFERIGFEKIWREEFAPKIDAKVTEISAKIGDAHFLDDQERLVGFRSVKGPMTAYLLYFSKPHGIRITGPRYLTAYDYPVQIILQNAVHEPMHAPFAVDDKTFWEALAPLRKDTDLMNRVENHNPDFGYNSFEGVIEEGSVQALEQIISEKMGVAWPAGPRWKRADDGLHIFAAAVYILMKDDGYDKSGGNFQKWLSDPKTVSRLAGHVKELAERVMGEGTVKPLPPRKAK